MGEAQLAREPTRTTEGLGRERGEVVDVIGTSGAEQRLQERIGEDAVVEDLLEAVQRLLPTGMLEQRGHRSNIGQTAQAWLSSPTSRPTETAPRASVRLQQRVLLICAGPWRQPRE